MRFFVTGGAGFVGSHLVDALTTRGDSVIAPDDLSTDRRENIGHHLDLFASTSEIYGIRGARTPPADITAIKETIGWVPTRDVDEVIDDVIAYERGTGSARGRLRLAG